jgi:hypothetical protein
LRQQSGLFPLPDRLCDECRRRVRWIRIDDLRLMHWNNGPGVISSGRSLAVNRRLYPGGHRHGYDVGGLANQIGDDPVFFPLL